MFVFLNYKLLEIKLNSRQRRGTKELKDINWLPTKEYWKGNSPFYVIELFVHSRNTYNTMSHMALEIPLSKSN